MEYLIPLLVAYGVYLFHYRKILNIRSRLIDLKGDIMNENDKWIIKKFDDITSKISHLESRLSKLEARLGAYVAIAVFVSQAFIKYVLK